MKKPIKQPIAKKIAVKKTYHGDSRLDNYAWMGDKKDSDFLDYLKAENEYFNGFISDRKELKEKIYKEMIDSVAEADIETPFNNGECLYYYRSEKGKSYKIFCRRKNDPTSKEEILLDINQISDELGTAYCNVEINISKDNSILVYGVDSKGNFSRNFYFLDLTTGGRLPDVIPGASLACLTDDNKYAFYVRWRDGDKGKKVFRHKMGNPVSDDIVTLEEFDDSFFAECKISKSGKFILILLESMDYVEYYCINTSDPESKPKLILSRDKKIKCRIEHNGDHFYILTNYKCENFRLMRSKIDITSLDSWEEVIPGNDKGVLEEMEMFEDFIAIRALENALIKLRILNIETGEISDVPLPDEMCWLNFEKNFDFDSNLLRFAYSSLNTPLSDYEYNMSSGKLTLLKEREVNSDFDKDSYVTERVYAAARDGTQVPLSIVYKKGLKKNGKNPLYLYAYGAFGISSYPHFHHTRLPLLDRGFILVTAHIRGGMEVGKNWHYEGRLLKKMNSFNDYIDSAKYLVQEGYTSPEMLIGVGGSAGGTLMGVTANNYPELFKCLIILVPAADLLNTSLEKSNFNAVHCMDEYGNPEEKKYYDYIKSYDPYENVTEQKYPNILVTTGYNDGNVSCSEAAKYIAKLQEKNTGENVILFKTDFETGHLGSSSKYVMYRDISENYVFLFKCLGINE